MMTLFSFPTAIYLGVLPRYSKYLEKLKTKFPLDGQWRHHLQGLVKKWTNYLLIILFLTCGVSLLLVLVNGLNAVSQTAILISTLTVLGSLLLGLYCVSFYRRHSDGFTAATKKIAERCRGSLQNLDEFLIYTKGVLRCLSLPLGFLLGLIVTFNFGEGRSTLVISHGLTFVLGLSLGFALWYIRNTKS